MPETSASLLDRLRHHATERDWYRFVDIYGPLLLRWLKQQGIQHSDACDLSQEILQVVIREMPTFEYDPEKGSFRAWLRTIMFNRLKSFWRGRNRHPRGAGADEVQEKLAALEDTNGSLDRNWDAEYNSRVARRILSLIRSEFEKKTWQAFWQVVVDGARPADVAANLGLTVNAVYLARFRVLRRLKEEGEGLLE